MFFLVFLPLLFLIPPTRTVLEVLAGSFNELNNLVRDVLKDTFDDDALGGDALGGDALEGDALECDALGDFLEAALGALLDGDALEGDALTECDIDDVLYGVMRSFNCCS